MLHKSIVQLDLKEKVIKLTDTKKNLILNKKSATKLYLINGQKSPYIWINLKGKTNAREQLLIDTGMKGFYDLSLKNFRVLQKNTIFKIHNEGIGSKGIAYLVLQTKASSIRL